jgi:hypothetical protein
MYPFTLFTVPEKIYSPFNAVGRESEEMNRIGAWVKSMVYIVLIMKN